MWRRDNVFFHVLINRINLSWLLCGMTPREKRFLTFCAFVFFYNLKKEWLIVCCVVCGVLFGLFIFSLFLGRCEKLVMYFLASSCTAQNTRALSEPLEEEEEDLEGLKSLSRTLLFYQIRWGGSLNSRENTLYHTHAKLFSFLFLQSLNYRFLRLKRKNTITVDDENEKVFCVVATNLLSSPTLLSGRPPNYVEFPNRFGSTR